MDKPKCRICGKKHYGLCSGLGEDMAKNPPEDVRESIDRIQEWGVESRLSSLEAVVDELLQSKRKRSQYMKKYMRKYRG